MSHATSPDVIVLGLGAMGSAALYQLSKRGVSVLGIDQFAPPHPHGSTHGDTRLTRQAIGEGDAYTPLALRSYEIWKQIERESGAELLSITGGLVLAPSSTSAPMHGSANFMESTVQSAKKFHIAHETLTSGEIQTRFPRFKLRGDECGYFEQNAGFLRPERCVQAQLMLAQRSGAEVHTGEKGLHFSQQNDGVRVQTDKAAYHAQKLIVTAGPWVRDFLPATHQKLFKVYRQVLYWFDVAEHYAAFTPDVFPVFIWDFGDGDSIYGFPAINGKHGGLKIAHEEYIETTDPAQTKREVSDAETQTMYDQFVAPRLSGVRRTCLRAASCLYTVTPDFGFVLDTHPDSTNIFLASPCSGHGFKHSAAIGEVLAQWAVGESSAINIGPFALTRFGDVE